VVASAPTRALSRQSRPQCRVDLIGGLLLHAGQYVTVRVQGDADEGVTEALGDDLGVHAGPEKSGNVRGGPW